MAHADREMPLKTEMSALPRNRRVLGSQSQTSIRSSSRRPGDPLDWTCHRLLHWCRAGRLRDGPAEQVPRGL